MKKRYFICVIFVSFVIIQAGPLLAQVSGADTDFLYSKKLYDDRMYRLSASEFTRFIRNYPNDMRVPDARYFAGISLFHLGQFDASRREFQFLAIDYPKDKRAMEAWIKISECYSALKDYAAAANALSSLVSFYPQSPNVIGVHLLISDYFVKAGDRKSAKDKLNKFISDYPDIPELFHARFRLAAVLTSDMQYDLAISEYQQIIERAKDSELKSSALFEKAKLLDLQGKNDFAKSDFATIVNRYAKTRIYPDALYETGLYAYREKKSEIALTIFENVIRSETGSNTLKNKARLKIGDIHFSNAQYDKALSFYRTIVESVPDTSTAVKSRFKLALAYEKRKQLLSANEQYAYIVDSLSSVKEDSAMIALSYIRMAVNQAELKNYQASLALYNYFIDHYPHFTHIDRIVMRKIQLLNDDLHDYNEASHQLELFISQYPKSRFIDSAYLQLSRVYIQSKRTEKATDLLESFRYKFPGSRYLHDVKNELERIQFYYSENNESTVENIITLMGQLIEGKAKDELELTYGKLFFNQLKNYSGAISIFRKILNRTANRDMLDEVNYHIAMSFDRMAQSQQPVFFDSAFTYYKKLGSSQYADAAQLRIIELNLMSAGSGQEFEFKGKMHFMNWLERFPKSPLRDCVLFRLGKALYRLNELTAEEKIDSLAKKAGSAKTAKDSLKIQIPVYTAFSCFDEIIQKYPNSEHLDDAHFYKSLCIYRLNPPADVIKSFHNYLTLFPRGRHAAETRYQLARLREKSGDPQSAIAAYEDLMANYFYTSYADSAAQGIGDALIATGKYQSAVHAFHHSQKYMSDEFSGIDLLNEAALAHSQMDYQLGFAYHRLGNTSKAVEYYEKYLFPDHQGKTAQDALWALAEIYFSQKDKANAIRYFTLLTEKFPGTDPAFRALNRIAEIYYEDEKYSEAKKAFQKLSELSKISGLQMAYDAKVIVCTYRTGAVDQTTNLEKLFSKKYEKEKGSKILLQNFNAEFLFELGRYYQYTLKNYDLASKTYLRLTDQYKSADIVSEGMFQLGVIRFNQGKSKEGFEWFQQIVQKYPDSDIIPGVYLRMAVEAFKLEQVQTAIESAKFALQHPKIKPSDAKTGTDFLIKVYKTVGYYENALVLIQRYIDQFPDDDAGNLLSKKIDVGIMHRNLKSYDRATEYLKELLKTASGEDEAEIQYHIAQTYYDRGQFQQALIEFLRIPYLQLGSKFDWATAAKSQAAECYVKLEQYPSAISVYEDIIKKHGHASEYGLFAKQRLTEIRKLIKN